MGVLRNITIFFTLLSIAPFLWAQEEEIPRRGNPQWVFRVGDHVYHDQRGLGIIVATDPVGNIVGIDFDPGHYGPYDFYHPSELSITHGCTANICVNPERVVHHPTWGLGHVFAVRNLKFSGEQLAWVSFYNRKLGFFPTISRQLAPEDLSVDFGCAEDGRICVGDFVREEGGKTGMVMAVNPHRDTVAVDFLFDINKREAVNFYLDHYPSGELTPVGSMP